MDDWRCLVLLLSMASYLYTLLSPQEGFFKDRGSKFYAFAFPVESLEAVQECRQALRREYHDARHHCAAYRLGLSGDQVWVDDDGEPAHSAGDPILAAIRSADLTNILVVVVRYFGGTKLGIRGLIEAYRQAADEALTEAATQLLIPKVSFWLRFTYPQTSLVNQILHRHETEEVEALYDAQVALQLRMPSDDFPPLAEQLTAANLQWELVEEASSP